MARSASSRTLVRLAGALASAAAMVLAACLLHAVPAAAGAAARDAAVAALDRRMAAGGPEPDDGGYLAVRTAWADAGLDLRRADALAGARPWPDGAISGLLDGVCAAGGWMRLPAERPRPGDLAVALSARPPRRARLGMFVGAEDLIAPDAGGRLRLMRRQEFLPDDGAGAPAAGPLPLPGAACHVDPALLPDGGDAPAPSGRVALADPGMAAAQLDWAAGHPRDAGSGPWHALASALRSAAVSLSGLLAEALSAGIAVAVQVLSHTGVAGAGLLAVAGATAAVLSARFDGRRLHAVLTALLLGGAALVLLGPGAALVAAAVAAGLLGGASLLGVPVLGATGRALWAAAGVITTVVTGVEDSDHASVGEVLFALAADALVWARPAALGLRVVELGGRAGPGLARVGAALAGRLPVTGAVARSAASGLELGLGAATTTADAVMLRPHAWVRGVQSLARLVRGQPLAGCAEHAPVGPAGAIRHLLGTTVDLAGSLTWRRGSLVSDLVGHAGSAAGWLRADITAGAHSWPLREPVLHDILARVPEARRSAILDVALPRVRELGTLSHLHSGAHTVSTLAGGGSLQTVGGGLDTAVQQPQPAPLLPPITTG